MLRRDLLLTGTARRRLRLDDSAPSLVGETGEVARARALRPGHEPLLHRLFRHAHVPADVGPGRARAAGLIDEVPDQVVGHLAEVLPDGDGVAEPLQRVAVGVAGLHEGDEVVEAHCGGHASTLS